MGITKRLAGRKAYHNGKSFEDLVRIAGLRENIHVIPMPLGMKRVGRKCIPVKTPFDMTLLLNGKAVFVDCKSFELSRLTYSMLTPHQVMSLRQIEATNHIAGYLVFFRECDRIVFFSASSLTTLTHGSGLGPEHGLNLGTELDFKLSHLFTLDPWVQR